MRLSVGGTRLLRLGLSDQDVPPQLDNPKPHLRTQRFVVVRSSSSDFLLLTYLMKDFVLYFLIEF